MSLPYFFMSDLHLSESQAQLTRIFVLLLDHLSERCEALYLLGDVFDVWIGDDIRSPFCVTVMEALKKFTEKRPIFWIVGNRDFLIGEQFCAQTGVQLCADLTFITLFDKRILLAHGDQWCTDDAAYVRLRAILRDEKTRWLLQHLPLAWRQKLAQTIRKKSKQYTRQKTQQMLDIQTKNIEKYWEGVDWIIHGHTHQAAAHQVSSDGALMRWVLRDWCELSGAFLQVGDDGVRAFRVRHEYQHGLIFKEDPAYAPLIGKQNVLF